MTNDFCFDIMVERLRKVSSVGRASALQAEGHRFEPCTFHQRKNIRHKSLQITYGLEVGAVVNDSPGDCQSRRRPRRAVRAATEPCTFHQDESPFRDGLVAQLVRALACHARGRGFEPHPSRQLLNKAQRAGVCGANSESCRRQSFEPPSESPTSKEVPSPIIDTPL